MGLPIPEPCRRAEEGKPHRSENRAYVDFYSFVGPIAGSWARTVGVAERVVMRQDVLPTAAGMSRMRHMALIDDPDRRAFFCRTTDCHKQKFITLW